MNIIHKVDNRVVICTRCDHTFYSQAARPVCSKCRSPVVVDYTTKTNTSHTTAMDDKIVTINNKIAKVVSSINQFFEEYDQQIQENRDKLKQIDLHHDESKAFEKQVRSGLARIKRTLKSEGIKMVE